jgi:uncharacterized protein (DUF433 family)
MQTILSIDLITTDAAVRNGRPCIAGTALRVTDVAMAHLYHQRTADQVVADYELTLAQVHAALAYYYQHKAELDADIRSQVLTARQVKEQNGGGQASLLPG